MSAQRRLFGIGTSRTIRAHWMLRELDLDYETRAILPRSEAMDDPAFLALNPRRKVPFLEDGPVRIGESGAIACYLADRYRDRAVLSPEPGTPEHATFTDLAFFILTELDATTLYVLRRHEGLADVYGAAPAACEVARAYWLRMATDMERRLADGRPFLLGEAFGALDVLFGSCLLWAQFSKIPLPEAFAAYRERLAARPAFSKAMAVNFPPEALAALGAPVPGTQAGR